MSKARLLILMIAAGILCLGGTAWAGSVAGTVQGEGAGIEVTAEGTCVINSSVDITDAGGNFTVTWGCNGECEATVKFVKNNMYVYGELFTCDTIVADTTIAPVWERIPSMTGWGIAALVVIILAASAVIILRRRRVTA